MQVCSDYEHIFIIDEIGRGLAWADQALSLYKDRNHGKYIMVLDDDDEITNKHFVSIIKDIFDKYDPNIIIWRGYFTEIGFVLPPIDFRWGNKPERALIGSFNYCMKKELYDQYIHICQTGLSGDFDFINAAFKATPSNKIYWLKKVLVQTQQKSFGTTHDRLQLFD
jgi:hypothetical protein